MTLRPSFGGYPAGLIVEEWVKVCALGVKRIEQAVGIYDNDPGSRARAKSTHLAEGALNGRLEGDSWWAWRNVGPIAEDVSIVSLRNAALAMKIGRSGAKAFAGQQLLKKLLYPVPALRVGETIGYWLQIPAYACITDSF